MATLHQQEDQEDRGPCLLPVTVLHQSRALATCLHAHDLSRLSRSSHACQSFWSQVQSLHVPFFQYSLPPKDSVNRTRTDGFRRACHQGQLISLVNLSLHGANLADSDLESLANDILPLLPQLEVLDLSHNPSLGHPGLTHLAHNPHPLPPNLRDLRLAHNSDMCRGMEGGEALLTLLERLAPGLKCLDLTQTGLTKESFSPFIHDNLVHPPPRGFYGLRELKLGQNILEELRSKELAIALATNTIECPPGTSRNSSSSSYSNPLEVLNLNDCYMGGEGLGSFFAVSASCSQFWSLRELHLQNNRCGGWGAFSLGMACVEGFPALEILDLRMNMMGDNGVKELMRGIVRNEWEAESEEGKERRLPRLKRLNLSHNMIDAVGVVGVLGTLLVPGRCPSLEEIDLSHNAVGGEEALSLKRITQLSISSSTTTVTTNGAATITINVNEQKTSDVNVILSPTGLYCKVLLEGEEEGGEGGREGGKRERPDALMLLDWTVQALVGMIRFAITRE